MPAPGETPKFQEYFPRFDPRVTPKTRGAPSPGDKTFDCWILFFWVSRPRWRCDKGACAEARFATIRLDSVGFGWIWLDLVGFTWILDVLSDLCFSSGLPPEKFSLAGYTWM
jgi:hypothetical protein